MPKIEKIPSKSSGMTGKHHSEETKRKIGDANRGKKWTDDQKKRLSETQMGRTSGMKGKHQSDHAKQLLREFNTGKTLSVGHKRKISESNKGRKLSPLQIERLRKINTGRKHTDEAKQKISVFNKGKKLTKEHCEKISKAKKGKPVSEATARGRVLSRTGSKASDETKEKMSISRKQWLNKQPAEYWKRQSDIRTGELNHNWQGGISFEPYCAKFNDQFKEKIRNQFNRCCFICGKSEFEQMESQKKRGMRPTKLSVHHVNYDKSCLCNDVNCEFVALCHSCHLKTNGNRDHWEELIHTKLINYSQ